MRERSSHLARFRLRYINGSVRLGLYYLKTTLINMNTLICVLFASLAVSSFSAPVENTTPVAIVAYTADGPNPDGSYIFSYESANGIKVAEQGQPKQLNETNSVVIVEGSYSYPAADGTPVSLSYVADENGFQPKGEHLPTPPPIPAGILKALEYIAAHPEQDQAL
ncbi:endocuticle structural glycoprotein SgAbd-2-like [Osmia bicornis bicornis]|uniref:endocuticle structural glycoprotein SgAbd-2-like n=1 Tax=Osmia bicornis bicornis TaxID=1437191 RepID=UPI001EAF59E8|nr:endocuticle structural glycoprotein SgAbd-2-like [Osmia bicornis bicornis]